MLFRRLGVPRLEREGLKCTFLFARIYNGWFGVVFVLIGSILQKTRIKIVFFKRMCGYGQAGWGRQSFFLFHTT